MADKKNIFISHLHEDDALLPRLKELISRAGMEVRDASINSDKPNNAKDPDYIMNGILKPGIDWASTLVVLISHGTHESEWVNKEIKYAAEQGKQIVGVYAPGATKADLPEELEKLGDAAIVGWQGARIVQAINEEISDWDDPESGEAREPVYDIKRVTCK